MKRYYIFVFMFTSLVMLSCGLTKTGPVENQNHQFYVESISPAEGSELSNKALIKIQFSHPVLENSVTAQSLFILNKEDYTNYEFEDWDELYDDVVDEKVAVANSVFSFNSDFKEVYLTVDASQMSSGDYVVVALPKIQSQEYYPLNQTVVEAETEEFKAFFTVKASEFEVSYPDVSDSSDEADKSDLSDESDESDAVFNWERVLITEVVTDPQQDHNDSENGNGIAFDAEPGTGTIGSTDEYIEIFNGTSLNYDMSAWSVNMIDGTDVLEMINDESWDMYSSLEDDLTLEAGEFVVLGNPDGAINNSVTIELIDEIGELIDSVEIEDANASGLEDEAFYLDEAGEWGMGAASPGGF